VKDLIKEPLSSKDLQAILTAANDDMKKIRQAYDVLKKYRQHNDIDDLTAFLITAIKKQWTTASIQKAERKSAFCNFEGRDYDFEKLEELERQYLEDLDRKIVGE
jgi:hypothetical protein